MEVAIDFEDFSQWETVYEPSSDTFFLCDGISAVAADFPAVSVIAEIGCGSGYVSIYTAKLLRSLGKVGIHFATDINIDCCNLAQKISQDNRVIIAPIRDFFVSSLRQVDVLIFNPPYVETPKEELEEAQQTKGIAASWAGGEDGADVVYECLQFLLDNRQKFSEEFRFVLLLSRVNKPKKMARWCSKRGLQMKTVLEKNCQGESLLIVLVTFQK